MNTQYFDLVNSPLKGTNLIEASAGTGKTYIIAGLFLRLILEKRIPADQILTVTYTEAATEELRHRIRERLRNALSALTSPDDFSNQCSDDLTKDIVNKYRNNEAAVLRLRDALTRFDEASICTIHGFCKRMLSENAFESNSLFNAELLTDQSGLVQETVDDYWRNNFYNASPLTIQYAASKNISTSAFLNLIKNLSIDPSFKVVPKLKKPDLSKIESRFPDAFSELQELWNLNKSNIEKILVDNKTLDGKKYGRYVPKWIAEMQNYLSSDNPFKMFEMFKKFTASSINDAVKKGFDPPQNKFFDACEAFVDIYDKTTDTLEKYILALEAGLFEFVKFELSKKKNKLNVIGFDDLLVNMHQALGQGTDSILARTVRARYKAALIDEFQDSDPVQYGIFSNIFGTAGSVLFLIGDPKQSIYKFRGADIFAYLKASKNIKNSYTLDTNWRSAQELLTAINVVFGNKEQPFVFDGIEYTPVKAGKQEEESASKHPFKILIIDKAASDKKDGVITRGKASFLISNSVAGEIHRLVSGDDETIGTLRPEHIAVLVRKNYQGKLIQDELRKFNIPAVVYGTESIFASREAVDMERLLTAIARPGDETKLKAALATDFTCFTGTKILELGKNETHLEKYINRFYEYYDLWIKHGFFRMFRHFIENEDVHGRLLSFTDGERRMTNSMHLSEILHSAETENKLGIETLIKWLREKISSPGESDENEIRLETDDEAVKILTIHRSKGLEFPVVFCPFTWEGSAIDKGKPCIYHSPENNFSLTLDLACEDGNRNIAETEELAENTRLMYVALTRAKYRTYLYWGRINKTETSAPAYIFHDKHKGGSEAVTRLKDNSGLLTYESILNDINILCGNSGNSITAANMPEFGYKRRIIHDENPELNNKIFKGHISSDWTISSFTALTHGAKEYAESPDHDRIDDRQASAQQPEDTGRNIFTFPKGSTAGTCIHEIFEKIDFSFSDAATAEQIIKEALAKFDFAAEWQDTLFDMINKVLNAGFAKGDPDFMLKNIQLNERLNEFEFYFPLNTVTSKGLSDIFRKSGIKYSNNFAAALEHLGFKPHRGFLKGFIDLIFQYKNKFYIVDWKSNHLGNGLSSYSSDRINAAMTDHYYILQYYIYVVAFHNFLKARIADYQYEKHFGGVYYLFIRGVDPDSPGSGMYYDVPPENIIQSLSSYLLDAVRLHD